MTAVSSSMSANRASMWVGLQAVVRHSVADLPEFINGLINTYGGIGQMPDRLTYMPPKVGAFATRNRKLQAIGADPSVNRLLLWAETVLDAGEATFYLRDAPKAAEFERRWSGAFVSDVRGVAPLLAIARLLDRHFGVVAAGLMAHVQRDDILRETQETGDRDACTPSVVERIEWDAWKWRRSHEKLRRLYPITIIGPSIWATLPPMPAFDPMPRVEDLGDCKVLTAWPTLCEPRDPAFLRATRDLRAWLWPYTIQNPADHLDHDPPPA
jgi:hypothetical protein